MRTLLAATLLTALLAAATALGRQPPPRLDDPPSLDDPLSDETLIDPEPKGSEPGAQTTSAPSEPSHREAARARGLKFYPRYGPNCYETAPATEDNFDCPAAAFDGRQLLTLG